MKKSDDIMHQRTGNKDNKQMTFTDP